MVVSWVSLGRKPRAIDMSPEGISLEAAQAQALGAARSPPGSLLYRGSVVGESAGNVTAADFADLWDRLARRWGSGSTDAGVMLGLMNEPHGLKSATVVDNTNKAIAAIRSAGAKNVVAVCGNRFRRGVAGTRRKLVAGNGGPWPAA